MTKKTKTGDNQGPNHQVKPPRLIALELTRSCVLSCKHCRASATTADRDKNELSKSEYFSLIENIAGFAKPILVLTGGEPMLRPDLYEIIRFASGLGLPVALAPCGVLIDDSSAAQIADSGVRMVSISLDGADAETHDSFRGVEGAFDGALRGIEALKRAGVKFQINTTISAHNVHQIDRIWALSKELGASLFNPFFLVATGRGGELSDLQLNPERYESTLQHLAERSISADSETLPLRITCAPHYQRIVRQKNAPQASRSGGCLGGKSFAFISHRGDVQICGFLEIKCGNVRAENHDFEKIWHNSKVFKNIREVDAYRGRCGRCEYRCVCGGCRARAFAESGDYLGEEPFCPHIPQSNPKDENMAGKQKTLNQHHPNNKRPLKKKSNPQQDKNAAGNLADRRLNHEQRRILTAVQSELPIDTWPYKALSSKMDMPTELFINTLSELGKDFIKRLGPVFEPARLGYATTLVAGQIPEKKLEEVAEIVNEYTAVTHNYRRTHRWNLWFTLITRPKERQDEILNEIRARSGLGEFYKMPAREVYKIRAYFPLENDNKNTSSPTDDSKRTPHSAQNREAEVDFSDEEKKLVRLVQSGIPIKARPFSDIAAKMGWTEDEVAEKLRMWRDEGIVRRFGAILKHRNVGLRANGMCVFKVDQKKVDQAGTILAGYTEVSHCYERHVPPQWGYNLFAMTHAAQEKEVKEFAAQIAEQIGADSYDVLFSTHEYKKTAMKYFTESGND